MKTVLLTGGSSGIGLETAQLLMDKGFRVYSTSRSGGGKSQKSTISNGEIIPLKMDVNNENEVQNVIKKIIDENGSLYALISNAGNGIAGSVEDTNIEEVHYQFETNFFGSIKVIKNCLPYFRKARFGKIIAISSVAAEVPIPFQAFYSSSKAAISIMMESLSIEVKSFGIQCCTILPGDTKTEFTNARIYTKESQSEHSVYKKEMKKAVEKMEKDEKNGIEARVMAKAIVKQIEKRKMNKKVIPTFQYKSICILNKILPTDLKLKLIGSVYS